MKTRSALSLFLLWLMPAFAASSTSITDDFCRAIARSYPERLIALGYKKVGNLDLINLIQEIETVHYELVPGAQYAQGRGFYMYNVVNKTVFVPTANLGIESTEASTIFLHETLGALGYIDDNYEISNSLHLIFMETIVPRESSRQGFFELPEFQSPFNQPKRNSNPTNIQNALTSQYRGGSNGVGGGGDPHAALVKFDAIVLLLYKLRTDLTDAQIAWMNSHIGIETYATLPGKSEPVKCPLLEGDAAIDSSLLTTPSEGQEGMTKIYYPESCSETFRKKHGISITLLPARIAKKMIEIHSSVARPWSEH